MSTADRPIRALIQTIPLLDFHLLFMHAGCGAIVCSTYIYYEHRVRPHHAKVVCDGLSGNDVHVQLGPPDMGLGTSPLDGLPDSISDLHYGMPPAISKVTMRLLSIPTVLGWPLLKVYEDIAASECMEQSYGAVGDDVWAVTLVLSWRWGQNKPAAQTPGWMPMSAAQWGAFKGLLSSAQGAGLNYVWVDYSCIPQYCGDSMIEVLRSKVSSGKADTRGGSHSPGEQGGWERTTAQVSSR